MHFTICTIGFAGKTAEEFFRLLQESGVKKVIDIREHRIGQLSGFAKYPDLPFFLDRVAGIAYVHEPMLAPTSEIRKAYRKGKDWQAYESSFLELMSVRGVPKRIAASDFEGTVALLCSEPAAEKCHRRLVADLIAQHWRLQGHVVEIRHLFLEKPAHTAHKRKNRRVSNDKTPDQ